MLCQPLVHRQAVAFKATLPPVEPFERIRQLRQARGLSQEKLGVAVGFDVATARQRVHKIETNRVPLTTSTLLKIARALQTSPSDLLEGEGADGARGAARAPVGNEPRPSVDARILAQVIAALDDWAAGHRVQLAAPDKAEAVALLYPFFASHPDEPVKIAPAHENVLRLVTGGRR